MAARIGITTSFEASEDRLDHQYVRAVEKVGGLPILVPVLDSAATIVPVLMVC